MAISLRLLIWIKKLFRLKEKRLDSNLKVVGALRDPLDERDHLVGEEIQDIPEIVDMRNYVREVKSQGHWNSCVSHAICSAVELLMYKRKKQTFISLSEKFHYYYGRLGSGFTADQNKGMYPRIGIKKAIEHGLSPEILFQYDGYIDEKPTLMSRIFANPIRQLLGEYKRVIGIDQIKQTLARGVPVMVSVRVYDFWYDIKKDGILKTPLASEDSRGYHYVLLVGYNKTHFIMLNSWNATWGDKGYGYLPFDYKTYDEWIIELNLK